MSDKGDTILAKTVAEVPPKPVGVRDNNCCLDSSASRNIEITIPKNIEE
jgi:hypothetical protein